MNKIVEQGVAGYSPQVASPQNADVHMAEGTSRGQSSPVFHIQSFFGSGI